MRVVQCARRRTARAARRSDGCVGTEPFVDEALEQARLLGMPAYRMTLIPHPVQLLTTAELHALADAAMPGSWLVS